MKIGVVGLGLIGGSIFKKLSDVKDINVIGISRTIKASNISNDYNTLKDCNIIFVCTPMNETIDTLHKLENYISEDTIVTDVCSLKEFVCKDKYKFKFIPSHPMAGTEHSGWDNSFPDLFNNAKWAVTPLDNNSTEDLKTLYYVIETMGANVIQTTPIEHDKAVAMISHAPMLIAQALCKNIENNELAQTLASSGFRDTTRLALSNTEMADDMIQLNCKNILTVVENLNNNINDLIQNNYKTEAEKIKIFRQSLYK